MTPIAPVHHIPPAPGPLVASRPAEGPIRGPPRRRPSAQPAAQRGPPPAAAQPGAARPRRTEGPRRSPRRPRPPSFPFPSRRHFLRGRSTGACAGRGRGHGGALRQAQRGGGGGGALAPRVPRRGRVRRAAPLRPPAEAGTYAEEPRVHLGSSASSWSQRAAFPACTAHPRAPRTLAALRGGGKRGAPARRVTEGAEPGAPQRLFGASRLEDGSVGGLALANRKARRSSARRPHYVPSRHAGGQLTVSLLARCGSSAERRGARDLAANGACARVLAPPQRGAVRGGSAGGQRLCAGQG